MSLDLGENSFPRHGPSRHAFLERLVTAAPVRAQRHTEVLDEEDRCLYCREQFGLLEPGQRCVLKVGSEWHAGVAQTEDLVLLADHDTEESSSRGEHVIDINETEAWLTHSAFQDVVSRFHLLTEVEIERNVEANSCLAHPVETATARDCGSTSTEPLPQNKRPESRPEPESGTIAEPREITVLRGQHVVRGDTELFGFRLHPDFVYHMAATDNAGNDPVLVVAEVADVPINFPQVCGLEAATSKELFRASARSRRNTGLRTSTQPPRPSLASSQKREELALKSKLRSQQEQILQLERTVGLLRLDADVQQSGEATQVSHVAQLEEMRKSEKKGRKEVERLKRQLTAMAHRIAHSGHLLPPAPPRVTTEALSAATAGVSDQGSPARHSAGGGAHKGSHAQHTGLNSQEPAAPCSASARPPIAPEPAHHPRTNVCTLGFDVPFKRTRARSGTSRDCSLRDEEVAANEDGTEAGGSGKEGSNPPARIPLTRTQQRYRDKVEQESHYEREQRLLDRRDERRRQAHADAEQGTKVTYKAVSPNRAKLGYNVSSSKNGLHEVELERTWKSMEAEAKERRQESVEKHEQGHLVTCTRNGATAFFSKQMVREHRRRQKLRRLRKEVDEEYASSAPSASPARKSTNPNGSKQPPPMGVTTRGTTASGTRTGAISTERQTPLPHKRRPIDTAQSGSPETFVIAGKSFRSIIRQLRSLGYPEKAAAQVLTRVLSRYDITRRHAIASTESQTMLEAIVSQAEQQLHLRQPGWQHVGSTIVFSLGDDGERQGVVRSCDPRKGLYVVLEAGTEISVPSDAVLRLNRLQKVSVSRSTPQLEP